MLNTLKIVILSILVLIVFMAETTKVYSSFYQLKDTSIYDGVLSNNNKLSDSYAKKVSDVIVKISKKHKLNPTLLSAIIMQESAYKLNAKNCSNGSCTDFGIAQIHYKTVERYNFNKSRLLNDLEYSVEAGAIVLKDFKKMYAKKDGDWWTRYNSSNKQARLKYKKLVNRYQ